MYLFPKPSRIVGQDGETKFQDLASFPKESNIINMQIHGFCDASEFAYTGVIYFRGINDKGHVHMSLVMAKTKVAPIKRLTIPCLELCGAVVVAKLVGHVADILNILTEQTCLNQQSSSLSWLKGNPGRFKIFVGNRL